MKSRLIAALDNIKSMETKTLMYCYRGETWETTPIRDKAIADVGRMTQRQVAKLADIQQEMFGRTIHIKRITE
uniref:Uncharacterized protein n=1 Tax=viral metagenome TaxID=1070528 RepID=A0A6M3LH37_9ZZZZ